MSLVFYFYPCSTTDMFRKKCKKIIIVAPDKTVNELLNFPTGESDCAVCNIDNPNKIFTSLYEGKPDVIIFDHEFLKKDIYNILRRIKANPFYDSIKVYCFSNEADTKTDDLLKTLGVDHMIYKNRLANQSTSLVIDFKSDNILRLLSLNLAFK